VARSDFLLLALFCTGILVTPFRTFPADKLIITFGGQTQLEARLIWVEPEILRGESDPSIDSPVAYEIRISHNRIGEGDFDDVAPGAKSSGDDDFGIFKLPTTRSSQISGDCGGVPTTDEFRNLGPVRLRCVSIRGFPDQGMYYASVKAVDAKKRRSVILTTYDEVRWGTELPLKLQAVRMATGLGNSTNSLASPKNILQFPVTGKRQAAAPKISTDESGIEEREDEEEAPAAPPNPQLNSESAGNDQNLSGEDSPDAAAAGSADSLAPADGSENQPIRLVRSFGPNPVSNGQRVRFFLEHRWSNLNVRIFDISGRLRYANDSRGSQVSTFTWDLRGNNGVALEKGIYIVRISVKLGTEKTVTWTGKVSILSP
jgi:hypothetical protein